jgi:hypothetical protein
MDDRRSARISFSEAVTRNLYVLVLAPSRLPSGQQFLADAHQLARPRNGARLIAQACEIALTARKLQPACRVPAGRCRGCSRRSPCLRDRQAGMHVSALRASIPIAYDAGRHEGVSADLHDRTASRSLMPVLLEHRSTRPIRTSRRPRTTGIMTPATSVGVSPPRRSTPSMRSSPCLTIPRSTSCGICSAKMCA